LLWLMLELACLLLYLQPLPHHLPQRLLLQPLPHHLLQPLLLLLLVG
jgi:hypothetical protein